jgi:hypothetical protein
MSNYLDLTELGLELEKKGYYGEQLVVLTSSQWKQITEAYQSPLIKNISKELLVFHSVKEVETKITKWVITDPSDL